MFEFINQLCESKLLPTQHTLKNYTAKDISDITYLNFLTLQILRNEFTSKPFSIDYATKTITWGDFDKFRNSSNDLYVLINSLINKNSLKYFKDHDASKLFIDDLSFAFSIIKSWLRNIANGKDAVGSDKSNLLKIESMLKITNSDYKGVRRLVNDWNNLDNNERKVATTRLLLALRARAPKSELLKELENVSKKLNLEIPVENNPETDKKNSNNITPIIIGASIGLGLVTKGLLDLLKDGGKAKKY